MSRSLKAFAAVVFTLALLMIFGAALPAIAAPVLTNGDFEDNPPPNMGNNIGYAPTGWTIPSGNFNVIKVDGAGSFVYNASYPSLDEDASNPGPVDQHYLDVSVGEGVFYQVFTPKCSGSVRYGAAFSSLQNYPSVSSLSIVLDSDQSVIAPEQSTATAGGNTVTNPWSYFSFNANLTAGTAYRFVAKINDWSVFDNAFVEFETDCPEHNDDDIVDVKPQLCTAFKPEITCDTATGQTVVTLTNTASGFDPAHLAIMSQTSGVTAQQSNSDPLQVLLTGAQAGQNISLWVDAVDKEGGSSAGLDACCMGALQIQIPKDFVCEVPPVLDVTKTCITADGPVGETAQCKIDVHYQGPPPSPPLSITDTLTGTGAVLVGTPSSTDAWACSGTSPATCTIDAASDPSIDWANFTSTLQFNVSFADDFENCALGVASGLEDRACWSSSEPELTVSKTANQAQCTVGAPCDFTITVTNPSVTDFNGPLTVADQLITSAGQGGQFTAISPALCNPNDLATTGLCTGTASIPAGGSQVYAVTWIPPLGTQGETYEAVNCTGVASAGGQMGYPFDPSIGGDDLCATVQVGPSLLTIAKTGPAICAPNGTCTYQVTITNNGADYAGPMMLIDSAPAGYQVTGVTGPATQQGCGAGLPAGQLNCAYSASLAAGASAVHDITIAALSPSATQTLAGQNCAGLATLPSTAQTGDTSGQDLATNPNMAGAAMLGQSCVPVSYDPPKISVQKQFLQGSCAVGGACDFKLVITNQSTTQSYTGPVAISDNMTPAGYQVLGMVPPLCTPLPTTAPFTCAANVTLPPGGTQVITIKGFVPFGAVPAGQSVVAQNCAQAAPIAQGDIGPWPESLFDIDQKSCAQTMICGFACHMSASEAGKLSVEKVLLNPEACQAGGICSYQITVTNTSTVAMTGPLTLLETLPTSGSVVAVSSLPWSCGPKASGLSCGHPPITLNPGDTTSFQIDVAIDAGFAGPDITNCVGFETAGGGAKGMRQISPDPILQFLNKGTQRDIEAYLTARGIPAVEAARMAPEHAISTNGARLQGSGQQSCVTKTIAPPPDPIQIDPSISKTCTPAVAGPTGSTSTCTITVTSNSNPQPHHLVVTETLSDPTNTGATITGFGHSEPWTGYTAPVAALSPVPMTLLGSAMPASGQSVISATVQLLDEGYVANCVTVLAYDAANQPIGLQSQACAELSPAVQARLGEQSPEITVTKTADGPCVPDDQKKTATCAFTITATNSGDQPYVGPLVVTDIFKGPAEVISATASANGMDCRADTRAAHCLNGDTDIPAKEAFIILLTTKVRMDYAPSTFENCGQLGTAGDARVQAMVAQTALKALGKYQGSIDGQIGRQSRAALAELQTELGQTPSGVVDDALIAALGVPVSDAPACVTVDVPARPQPPKPQCDSATTVAKGGECVCRYKNMYQSKNGASCGCVKGTEFVKGKGCIKPRSDTPPAPRGPKCDLATTVLRGGECVCNADDYLKISPTQCAPERKVKRQCPKGQSFIMGLGCVEDDIYFGGESSGESPTNTPACRPSATVKC